MIILAHAFVTFTFPMFFISIQRCNIIPYSLNEIKGHTPSIVTWEPLGPRLLYARLQHSQGHISIFTCYAPTEVADEETMTHSITN